MKKLGPREAQQVEAILDLASGSAFWAYTPFRTPRNPPTAHAPKERVSFNQPWATKSLLSLRPEGSGGTAEKHCSVCQKLYPMRDGRPSFPGRGCCCCYCPQTPECLRDARSQSYIAELTAPEPGAAHYAALSRPIPGCFPLSGDRRLTSATLENSLA